LIVQQEKDGFLFWPIKEEKKICNGWKHPVKKSPYAAASSGMKENKSLSSAKAQVETRVVGSC
jgi:hypothetical protein